MGRGWLQVEYAKNPRCDYCNQMTWLRKPGTRFAPHDATIDHVVPRSAGGRDHPSNYALACRACNGRKGSKSEERFGHRIRGRMATYPRKNSLRHAKIDNECREEFWRLVGEEHRPRREATK